MNRRRFLLGGGAALLIGCDAWKPKKGFLGKMEGWNRGAEEGIFFHGGSRSAVAGLTPQNAFPQYKIGAAFPVVPAAWTLRVSGLVERPGVLTMDDLRAMPRADLRLQHHCVEGWSATADWSGVRVRDVAERVGADRRAKFVEFRSFEANPDSMIPLAHDSVYWSSWDRASALHAQTILAYGMNGQDLPLGHGGPLRLYSSVKLGYKNVKWLAELVFTDVATGGYWEDQGYEWYAGT
jgi:DMSO/TMAO reductase YedYZ molybdopterin-dependent catalytic subunit